MISIGQFRCLHAFLITGVQAAETDVFQNGFSKEEGVLRHESDTAAEIGFGNGPQVTAIQGEKQVDGLTLSDGTTLPVAGVFIEQGAKGVLELACELARQIVRRELSTNPNALQPVVREALGMLTVDTKMAAVRLNPVDLDVFAEEMVREFPNLQLNLVPDASVTVGGCLVEAAGMVVDGTVQRRWHKAVASLGLESAWEQSDDVR